MNNTQFFLEQINELRNENNAMKQTVTRLTTELEYTKRELEENKKQIDEIKRIPKGRMQQISSAIISAIAAGLITIIINSIFK